MIRRITYVLSLDCSSMRRRFKSLILITKNDIMKSRGLREQTSLIVEGFSYMRQKIRAVPSIRTCPSFIKIETKSPWSALPMKKTTPSLVLEINSRVTLKFCRGSLARSVGTANSRRPFQWNRVPLLLPTSGYRGLAHPGALMIP